MSAPHLLSGAQILGLLLALIALAAPSAAKASPSATNLGIGGTDGITGDWLIYAVEEAVANTDLNGDGDTGDRSVLHLRRLSSGITANLAVEVRTLYVQGDWLAYGVPESSQRSDLNGDGDMLDEVAFVRRLSTGATTNLGLDCTFGLLLEGDWLLLTVTELYQGNTDLNGDGDRNDEVLHLHRLSTGTTTNLRVAAAPYILRGDWLVLQVFESGQNADLTGDGDKDDNVLHVRKLSTATTTNLRLMFTGGPFVLQEDWLVFQALEFWNGDFNGDGDRADAALHVHRLSTGTTVNVGVSAFFLGLSGDRVLLSRGELQDAGGDLNGDGDTADYVLQLLDLSTHTIIDTGLAYDPNFDIGRGDGGWWVFLVPEYGQGHADLNGDGDTDDRVYHVIATATGIARNLGFAGIGYSGDALRPYAVRGDHFVFAASEGRQSRDLNGDGDATDLVPQLHRFSTGVTTNLGLASLYDFELQDDWLVFRVHEFAQRADLNADGDLGDAVLHVHALSTGSTTNVGLAESNLQPVEDLPSYQLRGNWLAWLTDESQQASDLNADGDTLDRVAHVRALSTGVNTNLGLAVDRFFTLWNDWLTFLVFEYQQGNVDLTGDGDAGDQALHLVSLGLSSDVDGDGVPDALDTCRVFSDPGQADTDGNGIGDACECGDQNGDATVNVLDLLAIKLAVFGAVPPSPLCDTNFDGHCNVQDIVGANDRIFGKPAYCERYPPPEP